MTMAVKSVKRRRRLVPYGIELTGRVLGRQRIARRRVIAPYGREL